MMMKSMDREWYGWALDESCGGLQLTGLVDAHCHECAANRRSRRQRPHRDRRGNPSTAAI